jgi:hypothetical protein
MCGCNNMTGYKCRSHQEQEIAVTRQPTGLSKLTAHDLSMIREIVLAVVDDGPNNDKHFPWDLYDGRDLETVRNELWAEIQRRIVAAGAPEVVKK